jgi:hypothetical protein
VTAQTQATRLADRTRWTEQSIEHELRRICQTHTQWPSVREFRDMGARRLYRAASEHGGIGQWRRRLAL